MPHGSCLSLSLLLGAGIAVSVPTQPVLYDGTGSPASVGFSLLPGSAAAGFQFDTPNAGELTIDTRAASGFLASEVANYEIPRCSGDTDVDDDYDADDANAFIAGVDLGSVAFHRVPPLSPSPSDAFDLGVILNDAADDACLIDPIEIVAGYTIEFAIKLLPGNEQTRVIVFEDVDDNPPDQLRPGTEGGFIQLFFEGEGADATVTINESTPENEVVIPAGDFDFSGFVTVQLLRRPADLPLFPRVYDTELPELYIDGERINPALPLFDPFDNPLNGIGLGKSPTQPDELLRFGDFSTLHASHAAIDFVNIIPGPTTVTELGACCLGAGVCESVTEPDCATQGGTFTADSGCSPAQSGDLNGCLEGACCLPDAACEIATGERECILTIGGVFQGVGTDCETVECTVLVPCCVDFGGGFTQCFELASEADCLSGTDDTFGFPGVVVDECGVFGECTIP
ncbi:MAG: hypothetical protein AAGI30_12910 [Planctomycetota bacterium]